MDNHKGRVFSNNIIPSRLHPAWSVVSVEQVAAKGLTVRLEEADLRKMVSQKVLYVGRDWTAVSSSGFLQRGLETRFYP